jgi:hypothetical protein
VIPRSVQSISFSQPMTSKLSGQTSDRLIEPVQTPYEAAANGRPRERSSGVRRGASAGSHCKATDLLQSQAV